MNTNIDLNKTFQKAVNYHENGNLEQAEKLYIQILDQYPTHESTIKNYNLILSKKYDHQLLSLYNEKKYKEMLHEALNIISNDHYYLFAYKIVGIVYSNVKDMDNAIKYLSYYLKFNMNDIEVCSMLGRLLVSKSMFKEAQECYENILKLDIHNVESYIYLGYIFENTNKLDDAKSYFYKALDLDPNSAIAYCSLANIFSNYNSFEEAEKYYNKAIEINPNYVEAIYNLANLQKKRFNLVGAQNNYKKALKVNPHFIQAYSNLGLLLASIYEFEEAFIYYKKALEVDPNSLLIHNNLGKLFETIGEFEKAKKHFEKIIAISPYDIHGYNNLAQIELDNGNFEKAQECYLTSINLDTSSNNTFSNLLNLYNYHPNKTSQEIFKVYQEYERRFAQNLYPLQKEHNNSKDTNRKLKVAYVSADFYKHAVRHFLEPVLEHHNKDRFEIYLYSNMKHSGDEVTQRYKSYTNHWVEIQNISDEEFASKIKEDQIDILIDLSGHSKGNRLLTFARKPAPISMTWIGYGYTTGLSAIDYFLSDEISVPKGSENLFAENIYNIGSPCYVFRPAEGMGEVSNLPYDSNGYITFGTLTRSIRINNKLIEAWSKVLKAVPHSKLIMDSKNYKSKKLKTDLIKRFEAYGITANRLEIGYSTPPWDTLRKIDIGLDCFPHNSGTTLFETLYMGLPYVTFSNRPSVGTLGSTILHGIGKEEWIAKSEEEYVEKLIQLATNTDDLRKIRENLREDMKKSPLMDEKGFTLRLEDSFFDMFKRWIGKENMEIS